MKLTLALLLLAMPSFAQKKNDTIKVEFSSITRGQQEFVVITPDSIKMTSSKQKAVARALEKKEWLAIIYTINKLELSSVSTLKSPTMKRAYDGARHSTITITTQSQSYAHAFDDENPHEKLKPLLKIIVDKKKKLSTK